MDPSTKFRQLSMNDFDPSVRGYLKSRRYVVNRSISGCKACKLKKVKCDEEKPICRRCLRNSRQCLYGQSAQDFETKVLPTGSEDCGTPVIELLQHCEDHWEAIFHIPRSKEMLRLSRSNSLVLKVILAISACHCRTTHPEVQAYYVAECYHYFKVIEAYRGALATPRESSSVADAQLLLLVGVLLNIITFALPRDEVTPDGEPNMESSFVFSNSEGRLGWITLPAGFRSLLASISSHQEEIMGYLSSIFLKETESIDYIRSSVLSPDAVPEHWLKIFDLSREHQASDCESNDVYRLPLTVVANIRCLEPIKSNSFWYLSFLMKVDSRFRALLFRREKKAMWLLGYWLGLMCRFEKLWWCEKRAQRDYKAVCLWFKETEEHSDPGRFWPRLMDDLFMAPMFPPQS